MATRTKQKHLIVRAGAPAEYEVPPMGRDPDKPKPPEFPARNAGAHGARLVREYDAAAGAEAARAALRPKELTLGAGTTIDVAYDSDFKAVLKKLESEAKGIELLVVKEAPGTSTASIFVPTSQLKYFATRIAEYVESAADAKPKHAALVATIEAVRRAEMKSLWTDRADLFPAPGSTIWWEVWLRGGRERGQAFQNAFVVEATRARLKTQPVRLDFIDRTVVLALGTAEQVAAATERVDLIAELRRARDTPFEYLKLRLAERGRLVRETAKRIDRAPDGAPAVLVLDTGTNNGHPLLASIDERDLHAWDPAWGVTDHDGHGTGMAGLALLGDLVDVLRDDAPVALEHRLESGKISPPAEFADPLLDGLITQEVVARAEATAPNRPRVMCLATTRPETRENGRPSSWSAAVDDLAFGAGDGPKRLVVISGGNIDGNERYRYPTVNFESAIQSPAQAWNALTVGAFTEKEVFADPSFAGWRVLAPRGGLSPSSTTSRTFDDQWALKPDITMEGGNFVQEPNSNFTSDAEGLSLLTTGNKVNIEPLVMFHSTSAATALASRFAARIMRSYPSLWPETIRALMVHSADWTDAMKAPPARTKADVATRIRTFGFGTPNFETAMYSAGNALTLIAQDELQPFERAGTRTNFHQMRLFDLPWPRDALMALTGEAELRVTLSYFIEPSPGERGWDYRHRYPSHGLRFDVIRPTEANGAAFRDRVSAAMRGEDYKPSDVGAIDWLVGPVARHRGSLHHDRWLRATGPELARCNVVAVFPVAGWWKERPRFDRADRRVRFSLVVSIHTPATDVDLYTPVETLLTVPAT